MAIFDSEKRPKGFRVPSFGKKSGASKSQTSFHSKKSTGSVPPDDDPMPIPGPAAYPAPPRPRPLPNKELPPTPNEARGQPPPRTTSIPRRGPP
ncbi:hypothetical protein NUU61_007071 [Penicillium alfredii]|uniref:Uncharacterized protein n=1 Tax=Penicillium alfredii TaxID=1506179 RepID=A0A9W9F2B2_9EURO|nr:uncharacterized protein NUU61_007071 [Penicillium alfredii]KAJ5092201.1 hypothetical protein NUU61_007071 [Penicillium alfredii]